MHAVLSVGRTIDDKIRDEIDSRSSLLPSAQTVFLSVLEICLAASLPRDGGALMNAGRRETTLLLRSLMRTCVLSH